MIGQLASAVAPDDTRLRWVDGRWLRARGVDGADLPLWSAGERENVFGLEPAAARRTGLAARPLAETVLDLALGGCRRRLPPGGQRSTAKRETELLSASG